LGKRYGGVWALRHVGLTLATGEVLLLTGHNGSGKTTLLRLLCTAIAPSAGTGQILGLDLRRDQNAIRARTALVSHASYLYEDLSARENLGIVAAATRRREIDACLDRVGLSARAGERVRGFSAGMRKRLALARALIKAPALLFLDEPFGELDPQGMALVEALIGELQRSGTTLVLATHWVEQGERLSTQRLHLERGAVQ
jgi:heme exporter protein A